MHSISPIKYPGWCAQPWRGNPTQGPCFATGVTLAELEPSASLELAKLEFLTARQKQGVSLVAVSLPKVPSLLGSSPGILLRAQMHLFSSWLAPRSLRIAVAGVHSESGNMVERGVWGERLVGGGAGNDREHWTCKNSATFGTSEAKITFSKIQPDLDTTVFQPDYWILGYYSLLLPSFSPFPFPPFSPSINRY